MKNITKREKIWLGTAFASVLFYLYFFNYLPYFNGKIIESTANIKKYKDLLGYGRELSDEKNTLSLMESKIPNKVDSRYIINSINMLCSKNMTVLNKITFMKPIRVKNKSIKSESTDSGSLYGLPVSIAVSGAYEDITRLLCSIEGSDRLNEIRSCDLKYENDGYTLLATVLYYYIDFETQGNKDYDLGEEYN